MKKQSVYIACPYTVVQEQEPYGYLKTVKTAEVDNTEELLRLRVNQASKLAAKLIEQGYIVFSPLTHSHFIADYLDEKLREDTDFWLEQDMFFLEHCDILAVLKADGWETSKGVQREIERAKNLNKEIYYYEEN